MVVGTYTKTKDKRHWLGLSSDGTPSSLYIKAAVLVFFMASILVTFGMPGQATAASFSTIDRGVRISLHDTLINGTIHDLLLTVDTTGYTGLDSTFLHAISLRPLSDNLDSSTVLFRDPAGAASYWSLRNGQADPYTTYWRGNGTENGSGWFTEVFNGIAGFGTGVRGGIYLFRWRLDYKTSNPVTPPDFKAIYVDNGGQLIDQTGATLSPTTSPTAIASSPPSVSLFAPAVTPPPAALPEPGTIVGLGIFAAAIGLVHWRHRRQKVLHAKQESLV